MKLKKYFDNLEKKSEREKLRLVWSLTCVVMVGVLYLCLVNAGRNLSGFGRDLDVSQLPPMPDLGLDKVVADGNDLLARAKQLGDAEWNRRGDAYLKENSLPEQEGSTLQFAQAQVNPDATVIVRYDLYYHSVPVEQSGVVLKIDLDTEKVSLEENRLRAVEDIETEPKLTAREAAVIAQKEAGAQYTLEESLLKIVSIEGRDYLVWDFLCESQVTSEEAVKRVLVGAQRGSIVTREEESIEGENQASNIAR